MAKVDVSFDKAELERRIENVLDKGVTNCIDRESLEKKLRSGEKLRIKLGIDPTGRDLHIGHAVPILKLKAFQEMGHQIVIIIGDATGQVGDATDRESERPMLTREETLENASDWIDAFGKLLDMDKVEIRYNSEWLDKVNFCGVGEIAKNFSVREMLDRDMFAKRFEEGKRISLQEFLYPLMQGYDSVGMQADVEVGGNDQLFNLLAGRPIQEAFGQEKQDILTFELIEGTDGRKMSKSYKNYIAINDAPNDMFVKVMEIKDELIRKYFVNCTTFALDEIDDFEKQAADDPRATKKILAREIVTLYHGEQAAADAEAYFDKAISGGERPDDKDIVVHKVSEDELPIVTLIREIGMVGNSTEARNALSSGGVQVDGEVVIDPKQTITLSDEKVLIQVGKKKFGYVVKG